MLKKGPVSSNMSRRRTMETRWAKGSCRQRYPKLSGRWQESGRNYRGQKGLHVMGKSVKRGHLDRLAAFQARQGAALRERRGAKKARHDWKTAMRVLRHVMEGGGGLQRV